MKLLNVNNPATEELITQLPIDDGAGVAIKAQKARTAQPAWAATPLVQRRACIQTFRALVEKESNAIFILREPAFFLILRDHLSSCAITCHPARSPVILREVAGSIAFFWFLQLRAG